MSEDNLEMSEELKKRYSESLVLKQAAPLFKRLEMMSNKKTLPIIDLNVTRERRFNEKIAELKTEINELSEKEKIEIKTDLANPYPQVFENLNAFQFFKLLHETYENSKSLMADYSFIYRMMYNEGLILETFKPQMYLRWLVKEGYLIDELEKMKTLDNCKTNEKISNYEMLKTNIFN